MFKIDEYILFPLETGRLYLSYFLMFQHHSGWKHSLQNGASPCKKRGAGMDRTLCKAAAFLRQYPIFRK
jgi:hypothetical protein